MKKMVLRHLVMKFGEGCTGNTSSTGAWVWHYWDHLEHHNLILILRGCGLWFMGVGVFCPFLKLEYCTFWTFDIFSQNVVTTCFFWKSPCGWFVMKFEQLLVVSGGKVSQFYGKVGFLPLKVCVSTFGALALQEPAEPSFRLFLVPKEAKF